MPQKCSSRLLLILESFQNWQSKIGGIYRGRMPKCSYNMRQLVSVVFFAKVYHFFR